jgi:membrane protease YdiL (CAAX protease family)
MRLGLGCAQTIIHADPDGKGKDPLRSREGGLGFKVTPPVRLVYVPAMLSEKPWRTDAVLRLVSRMVICIFMGSLVLPAAAVVPELPHAGAVLRLGLAGAAFGLFGWALVLLGRPWRLETFTRDFILLLGCCYGGLFLTWWSVRLEGGASTGENPVLRVMIALLSFQGAALFLVHRFLREHGVGWAEAFGLRRDWRRALLLGVVAAVAFMPVAWGLQRASIWILERLHVEVQDQVAVQVLRDAGSLGSRLLLGVATVVLVPAAEESLFRGILYPAVRRWGFPRLAWWGTAVLFGATHCNLVTFVPLTVLALGLIWLYEKTDNLLAPVAAHTCFNAMGCVILYFVEPLLGTPAKP